MKIKFIKQILTTALIAVFISSAAFGYSYTTAVKNARSDAVIAQIDAGASAGKLEIGPSGMGSVCVTITLNDPSGTSSGGVLTLSGFPKTAAASATCTAAAARIRDSNNTDIITGLTVGTSGTNIVLDNTSINSGQDVTITSVTVTSGN